MRIRSPEEKGVSALEEVPAVLADGGVKYSLLSWQLVVARSACAVDTSATTCVGGMDGPVDDCPLAFDTDEVTLVLKDDGSSPRCAGVLMKMSQVK